MISRVTHTTHALPTPRACAANVMVVSGVKLASLLRYIRVIARLKETGFEVHEDDSVVSALCPPVNFCEHCTDKKIAGKMAI